MTKISFAFAYLPGYKNQTGNCFKNLVNNLIIYKGLKPATLINMIEYFCIANNV